MILRKINTALPSIFHTKPPETVCNLTHGGVPNVHSEYVSFSKKCNLLRDRKAFSKAILAVFIAKDSRPFTLFHTTIQHNNFQKITKF